MSNYEVNEYGPLDFENIVLASEPVAVCTECGTEYPNHGAGIHSCEVCGSFYSIDLEV